MDIKGIFFICKKVANLLDLHQKMAQKAAQIYVY